MVVLASQFGGDRRVSLLDEVDEFIAEYEDPRHRAARVNLWDRYLACLGLLERLTQVMDRLREREDARVPSGVTEDLASRATTLRAIAAQWPAKPGEPQPEVTLIGFDVDEAIREILDQYGDTQHPSG